MTVAENSPGSKPCPHCGARELFCRRMSSGTSRLDLLAGLGHFFHTAEMDVVVCAKCGLMRLFAAPEAREKVRTHTEWKRLTSQDSEPRPS